VEVTMVHALIRYRIETGCVVECARRIDDGITLRREPQGKMVNI
jgi:hypothetical protein